MLVLIDEFDNMEDEIDYLEMKEFNDLNEDMPDGAFFCLAEEMYGWDSDDWAWFSEMQEEDEDYK